MEQKIISIGDLLKSLQYPDKNSVNDSSITWTRIGNKDPFTELGLTGSELDAFLSEWTKNNPYNNLNK
jgi:hypothetical protein